MDEYYEDDPYDWDVDKVIAQVLQNAHPPWLEGDASSSKLNSEAVKSSFVDNDVTGQLLLTGIGKEELRDDLNVRSLGLRHKILEAISYLRRHSRKYQQRTHSPSIVGPYASPQTTNWVLQTSGARSIDSRGASPPEHHPPRLTRLGAFARPPQPPLFSETPLAKPSTEIDANTFLAQARPQDSYLQPSSTQTGVILNSTSPSVDVDPERVPEPIKIDRSQIAGTLRQQSLTEKDHNIEPQPSHAKVQRRIAPTLIGPPTNSDIITDTIRPDRHYLGPAAIPIERRFYPIDEVKDSREGFYIAEKKPPGERRLVSKVIRHYLRQPVHKMENSSALFRLPYPPRAAGSSSTLFTMFVPGAPPLKQSTANWPMLQLSLPRPEQPQQADDDVVFNASNVESSLEEDPYFDALLTKYPPHDRNVIEFDTESEGGLSLDDETWAEVQQEAAEAKERAKSSRQLSKDQVYKIMDKTIAGYVEVWNETKLPKVQLKAFNLWKRVTVLGRRRIEKTAREGHAHYLDRKIQKSKAEIAMHIWHKESELQYQCQSLEEHVYQREEALYFVSVLTSSKSPPRPEHTRILKKPAKQHDLSNDEEILDSESDVSLDGFVVDDTPTREDLPEVISPEPQVLQDTTMVDDELIFSSPSSASNEAPTQQKPIVIEDIDMADDEQLPTVIEDTDEEDDEQLPTRSSSTISSPAAVDTNQQASLAESERMATISDSDESLDVIPDLDTILKSPLPPRRNTSTNMDGSRTPSQSIPPLSQGHRLSQNEASSIGSQSHKSPNRQSQLTAIRMLGKEAGHEKSPGPGKPSQMIKTMLKSPRAQPRQNDRPSSLAPSVVSCTSDSSELYDLDAIKRLDLSSLESKSDSKRILVMLVALLEVAEARELHLRDLTEAALEHDIPSGIEGLRSSRSLEDDSNSDVDAFPDDFDPVQTLGRLYISFHTARGYRLDSAIPNRVLLDFPDMLFLLPRFQKILTKALDKRLSNLPSTKASARKRRQEIDLSTDTDELPEESESDVQPVQHTPHKKRKKAVQESQEALEWQKMDQKRMQEHEVRKKATMNLLGTGISEQDGPIISYGEVPIRLDPHIGSHAKPHQVSGIEFIWREVVANPKQHGCLLAHTMGLGKTMQVISFLCTLSQAANSEDPKIRDQVPERLRQNKTLVLAPASLINNWMDEFTIWTPPGAQLGPIRHFEGPNPNIRLLIIDAWAKYGGVLLIGYEKFRDLLNFKGKLTQEQHETAQEQLLSANIIVADEAHRMKNLYGKLFEAASKFKSKSRIALTGSPLANNLEEYYAMIQWISPGYLGDLVQFRSKYSEPIAQGLYQDSSRGERRTCLRRLHLLKKTLHPKVNRADISAISADMPQKTEFYLTVPLGKEQRAAYTHFIKMTLGTQDVDKAAGGRVFDWLAMLGLLCNHPAPFAEALTLRQKKTAKDAAATVRASPEPGSSADEDAEGPNETVSSISADLLNEQLQQLHNIPDLENPRLSARSTLIEAIIKHSVTAGEKVLLFSQSLRCLDYFEKRLTQQEIQYSRLDGKTKVSERQDATKLFNRSDNQAKVFLISTRAGGLGLNLPGASRVLILDFGFNPTWEEQAIGRAYRLGQTKPVFVYRFRTGGTFEEIVYNKSVFKTQMSARVVDDKSYASYATKKARDYLFEPREVEQEDLSAYHGKDPNVLDLILGSDNSIRNIELTETFQREDDEQLTAEELKEVQDEFDEEQLMRDDPIAFRLLMERRRIEQQNNYDQSTRMNSIFGTSFNPPIPGITPWTQVQSPGSHNVAYGPSSLTQIPGNANLPIGVTGPYEQTLRRIGTPNPPNNRPQVPELGVSRPRASSEAPGTSGAIMPVQHQGLTTPSRGPTTSKNNGKNAVPSGGRVRNMPGSYDGADDHANITSVAQATSETNQPPEDHAKTASVAQTTSEIDQPSDSSMPTQKAATDVTREEAPTVIRQEPEPHPSNEPRQASPPMKMEDSSSFTHQKPTDMNASTNREVIELSSDSEPHTPAPRRPRRQAKERDTTPSRRFRKQNDCAAQ